MKDERVPKSLECFADDNRTGFLIISGTLLVLAGWFYLGGSTPIPKNESSGMVFLRGLVFVLGVGAAFIGLRRMFQSGCQPLLRINHGGVTDFRLSTTPLRWPEIRAAVRWGGVLPVITLDTTQPPASLAGENLWSRLLHLPVRCINGHARLLVCGTLNHNTDEILQTIQSHLTPSQD